MNPPTIIIHGNQTTEVPASYKRYLENTFRKVLKIMGTPIRIEFRTSENPFEDRKREHIRSSGEGRKVTHKRRTIEVSEKKESKKKKRAQPRRKGTS